MNSVVYTILLLGLGYLGFSILGFMALVNGQLRGDYGWLRRLGEKINFVLSPWPPENVVVYTDMDGKSRIYYNVDKVKTERGWMLRLPHAYVLTPKLREVILDMLGADWPVDQSTPHNLAIRAVGALGLGFYMAYTILLFLWSSLDPVAKGIGLGIVMIIVGHLLLSMKAIQTPNVRAYELVEWGMAGHGTRYALPIVGPGGLAPVEFARLQGINFNIEVPETVTELFNDLKKKLKRDDLALARMLARAEDAEHLQVEISAVKKREVYSSQLARAYVITRVFKITLGRGIVMLLMLGIGFLLGWALSGGSVVVVPSEILHNATATAQHAVQHAINATNATAGVTP